MPSMILECPHCGAEKIGFTIVHDQAGSVSPNAHLKRFRSTLVCTNCEEAVVVTFDRPHGMAGPATPGQCATDPTRAGFLLRDSYPRGEPGRLPAHITDELKRYFSQAAEALKRSSYDASGAMSRKVLDVSTAKARRGSQEIRQHSKAYRRPGGEARDHPGSPGVGPSDPAGWQRCRA
jgi:hypothetical protein